MKTRFSLAIPALAFVVLLATPVVAQEVDAEKDKAAAKQAEMMVKQAGEMAQDEDCDCSCLKGMHEKMMGAEGEGHEAMEGKHKEMMEAKAEGEGHEMMEAKAEGEGHEMMEAKAEGEGHEMMEGDEAHAEMMEMMEACGCDREEAMECKKGDKMGDADDDGDAVPGDEQSPDAKKMEEDEGEEDEGS